MELERCDAAAGPDDAGELAESRCGILDVPQEVREGECVEPGILEGKLLGSRLLERDAARQSSGGDSSAAGLEHLRALVDADHGAPVAPYELYRDGGGARCDVEDEVLRSALDPRDHESPPARILAEAQELADPVVGVTEWGEEPARLPVTLTLVRGHTGILAPLTLEDELGSIAEAARGFLEEGEELAGVVPSELAGSHRVYLCAYENGERISWLAFDRDRQPLGDRAIVRDAASIIGLCELAEESAGGGNLPELRARLADLRVKEHPEGIEDAERAAGRLEETIASGPRVASAAYLDALGSAATDLERSLGGVGASPFAEAMRTGAPAVEGLVSDIEANYKRPLG